MKRLRMHHAAVICSDCERSRRFYIEVLGSEVVREVHRWERDSYKLDLRLPDGTQIGQFAFPGPPERPSYPEACGLRRLAFEVADLHEAVRELEVEGVVVESVRIDEHTGERFTLFAGPDGLPLELSQR